MTKKESIKRKLTMANNCIKDIKEYLENNFDILYWIDSNTAYVHYWDDDNGDYYLEENVIDLLDSLPPDRDYE